MTARKMEKPTMLSDAERFCADPAEFFDQSYDAMELIPREELRSLQLEALRFRFCQLRDAIPMLRKLSDAQGVASLDSLDDVVPLLFEHTMYKSYRSSLLEAGRFPELTRWLSRLTSFDLGGIDVSRCESIDDWVETLDQESPLNIMLSSGTGGTMSLIPVSKAEYDKFGRILRVTSLQQFKKPETREPPDEIFCVFPYFRYGTSAHLRINELTVKYIVGSEDKLLTAYPGKVSADILFLAARIRAAQNQGTLDRLEISPSLLARKEAYEQLQREMPEHLSKFYEEAIDRLRGKRVFMQGTWNLLHGMAKAGLDRGLSGVFAPGSIISTGGGAKGMDPPENWMDDVKRFVGADYMFSSYATGEVLGLHKMCEYGHYHFVPWVIPFLLDPDSSKPLPRQGTVTGRAAFFDLGAETRWGGFITGDELTINWNDRCPCGRESHFTEGQIRRLSDARGGDDKISCAATEGAHREAMEFLNSTP